MAKVRVDVLLKDGTDETAFINDVTNNDEVDLNNRLPSSPTLVVLDVEESYFDTLRSHSSVVSVEVEPVAHSPLTYPDKPSKYTVISKAIVVLVLVVQVFVETTIFHINIILILIL